MKRQPSAGNSLFVCQLKCTSDQLSAVTQADSVRNDFPRKQIDNHADIVIPVFQFDAGDITNPDFVGRIYIKTAMKKICFFLCKIMTCVLESKAHSGTADKINARMIFNILKKEYSDRVVFDSVDKTAHKLTPMLLSHKDDSGKGIMILDEKTGEVKDIMEESIILESIVKPISINRIYAEKEIADEVLTRIKELQSA